MLGEEASVLLQATEVPSLAERHRQCPVDGARDGNPVKAGTPAWLIPRRMHASFSTAGTHSGLVTYTTHVMYQNTISPEASLFLGKQSVSVDAL